MPYTNRYYENQGTGQEYGREGVFGDLRAQNRATQEQRGMARRQGAMYGPGSEGFGDAGRRLSPEAAQQQIATSRDYFANPSAYQGGSAMSRFANRQSPNQQAKIASMMEATMGNKRLSDRDLRNLQTNPRDIGGVGNPGWHDNPALRDEDLRNLQTNPPNPALRDEDMRRLGRLPPSPIKSPINPPNYGPPTPPTLRDEDMRGLITSPPLADEDIGRYDRDRVPDVDEAKARYKMVVGEADVPPLGTGSLSRTNQDPDAVELLNSLGLISEGGQYRAAYDLDVQALLSRMSPEQRFTIGTGEGVVLGNNIYWMPYDGYMRYTPYNPKQGGWDYPGSRTYNVGAVGHDPGTKMRESRSRRRWEGGP